jgi:hypothetical protein
MTDLAARIEALDARVTALEARPIPDYQGVWSQGTPYNAGAMVTHHSHLWITKRSNNSDEPGVGAPYKTGWHMMMRKPKQPNMHPNTVKQLIELVRNHLAATGRIPSTPAADGHEKVL